MHARMCHPHVLPSGTGRRRHTSQQLRYQTDSSVIETDDHGEGQLIIKTRWYGTYCSNIVAHTCNQLL
jgi:hypothetical protein